VRGVFLVVAGLGIGACFSIPPDGGTSDTTGATASASTDTSASGTSTVSSSGTTATTSTTGSSSAGSTSGGSSSAGSSSGGSTSGGIDPTGDTDLTEHHIFVTTSQFESTFGGIAEADAICQQHAEDAALSGKWVALLASSQVDYTTRIAIGGPVYNMLDELVALTKDQLDGGTAQNPVVYTEDLQDIGTAWVWLGDGSDHCEDWTSAQPFTYGRYSQPMNLDSWYYGETYTDCFGTTAHLFCIDQ
jgi:hypothetical protein